MGGKNKKSITWIIMIVLIIAGIGVHVYLLYDQYYKPVPIEKPVIYLYPTADNTPVDVHLDFNGELLVLDPEYNLLDGWQVTADKNGTIHYGDKTYPYLFWEGDPFFQMDFYSGYCVAGNNTEAFLTKTLTELGLNEQESEDFIEYWLPRMKNNKYNVISFQTENYTDNATLTIDPAPDTITRVFMAWYPSTKYVRIPQQQLPEAPARTGFTVIEWGGAEISK